MLKNKTKFIVLLLTFLLIISTFSFATDTSVSTSENEATVTSTLPGDNAKTEDSTEAVTEENTTESETEEIYNGDLYVFDDDITMDQLVDGNVFLFGNNINVTGKVNGSLYALGNTITFSEDAYIVQSIYVMGNQITINGCANDLYALANKIDMSYSSFMIRDLRVAATTFNFNGGVGRDAFVEATDFNFGTEEGNEAIVYGNLTYSATNELSLTTDFVQGEITYNQPVVEEEESMTEIVLDKVVSVCNAILYTLVVFFACLWLAPKFLSKVSTYIAPAATAKSFGIGLLTLIVVSIVSIALLFSVVGIPLGFAFIALLVLLISISTAITSTAITYKLKEKFNYAKNYITYLTLVGVIIVIWALELIPYAGFIITFVVKMLGLGIAVHYLFTKNKCNKEGNAETIKAEEKPSKKKTKKEE